MSLRQLVQGLFVDGLGDDVTIHYECRLCGAALDSADDECEACGSTEISRYVI